MADLKKNPYDSIKAVIGLYKAAKDYQEEHVKLDWEACFEFDDSPNLRHSRPGGSRIASDERLNSLVYLPKVHTNNLYKASILGSMNVTPIVRTEVVGLPYHAEIRQRLLRWGMRVSRLDRVMQQMVRDYTAVDYAIGQISWDPYADNGRAKPLFLYKDVRDIYVDPRRRQLGFESDCRFIFESQQYTIEECEELWPDKYGDGQAELTSNASEQHGDGVSAEERGLKEIVLCEFAVTTSRGRHRVISGILDPDDESWIVEPHDNGLGEFSYFEFSTELERKGAYPIPGNIFEHESQLLMNTFYGLAVESALKNISPHWWANKGDTSVIRSAESPDFGAPGSVSLYDMEPPKKTEVGPPETLLMMAQTMEGQTNESSSISQVQRGANPSGVVSGRAILGLTQNAEVPLDRLRRGLQDGLTDAVRKLDRIMSHNIPGYRQILLHDQKSSAQQVSINVSKSDPEFERILAEEPSDDNPYYRSARVTTSSGVVATTLDAAAEMVDAGEATDLQEYINDITLGLSDIAIELKPKRGEEQNMQVGMMLGQQNRIGPLAQMTLLGMENPNEIVKELVQYNEALQMGTTLQQNPEMMQVLQNVMSDPFLKTAALDDRFRAMLKQSINQQAAMRQQETPEG